MFFPFAGDVSEAVRSAGQMELDTLIGNLNKNNPLYFACTQSAPSAGDPDAATCDAARASVIVSTTLRSGSGGDSSLVIQGVDLSDHRTLGSVQKPVPAVENAAGTSDDSMTSANLRHVMEQLSDADVRSLIGIPVVRDGRLSIQPGFQPFIFCDRLPALAPPSPTVAAVQNTIPTPTPTPTATPAPGSRPHGFVLGAPPGAGPPGGGRSGGAPAGAGAPAAAGAAQSAVPLDIGNFLSATPPPLTCGTVRYGNPSPVPASAPLFNRRP